MNEPSRWGGSLHLLVAGLLSCVVAGACSQVPATTSTASPGQAPSAAAATHTPAAPTSTPAPTPAGTGAPRAGTWTLDTTLPQFAAGDLLVGAGGMIAVGCRTAMGTSGCVDAAIRVSDGGDWTEAGFEGDVATVELTAVAAGASGFVAVGRAQAQGEGETLDAAAFVSRDGRTWRRAPDQASLRGRAMFDVVARPAGGWIAVGAQAGPTNYLGFETWSSSDGITWDLVDSMRDTGPVRGVTTHDGGLIAWASDCLDVCGPPERASIWTSRDGRAWVRVPAQPTLAGGFIDSVMSTPTGALAIGPAYDAEGNGAGTTWRSTDGVSWSRSALPDASRYQQFRLTSVGDDLVAVGARHDGNDTTWGTWSAVGSSTWTRLPDADQAAATLELAGTEADVIAIVSPSEPDAPDASVLRLRLE
jgi:hypothetical protein